MGCRANDDELGNSVSLPWVIYYEAFYLHVIRFVDNYWNCEWV